MMITTGSDFPHMEIRWQFGQFLIYIGLILLIIFFITDFQQVSAYSFLCSGVLVVIAGVILMVRTSRQPPASTRFATFRKMGSKENKKKNNKDREEEKRQA